MDTYSKITENQNVYDFQIMENVEQYTQVAKHQLGQVKTTFLRVSVLKVSGQSSLQEKSCRGFGSWE